MTRTVWLDRGVPEAAVVSPCERAGWVRAEDQPRTVRQPRVLRFEPPEGGGRLTLVAFVHEGCQAVVLHGEPDARTGPVWDVVAALPRYEADELDAVDPDPARRMRGLRQWTMRAIAPLLHPWRSPDAARPDPDPALQDAAAAARTDPDPVVRAAAEEVSALLEWAFPPGDAAPNEG